LYLALPRVLVSALAIMFACGPCAVSDPTTDTVKVSFPYPDGKENMSPVPDYEAELNAKEEASRMRAEAEAEAARQAETARHAAEAEARRQAPAERQRAEASARAQAAADRAEAAARAQAAEAQRQEEELQLALQQSADEAARREAAEREAKAEADRKVKEYLLSHGFKDDVNAKKSSMMKYKYPLHYAVKEQNTEMVSLLLSAGADKSLKNSSGKTPAQKAEQYTKQKKGDAISTEVIRALGC